MAEGGVTFFSGAMINSPDSIETSGSALRRALVPTSSSLVLLFCLSQRESVAEATPACLSDAPTPEETEGPYFKPRSPERRSLLEPGIEGRHLVLSGLVNDHRLRSGVASGARFLACRCERRIRQFRLSFTGPSVYRRSGPLSAGDDRSRGLSWAHSAYPCEGAGVRNSDTDIAALFPWRGTQSN